MEKITSIASKSQPAAPAIFRSFIRNSMRRARVYAQCPRHSHAEWKPLQNRLSRSSCSRNRARDASGSFSRFVTVA